MKSFLQEFMDAKGLSDRLLADGAKISTRTVWKAKFHMKNVRFSTLCKLADFFGCCILDIAECGEGDGWEPAEK